jgi:hypothetical protein
MGELPGALDSFPSRGKSQLRLAGEVAKVAEVGERFNEEPAGVELAGEGDRLFPQLPCHR